MIYVISNLTLSYCNFLNDGRPKLVTQATIHTGENLVIDVMDAKDRPRAEPGVYRAAKRRDHRTASEEALRPAWDHNRTWNRHASETKEAREWWLARDKARRRHRLVSETSEERETRLSQRPVRDRAWRADQARKSRLQQFRTACLCFMWTCFISLEFTFLCCEMCFEIYKVLLEYRLSVSLTHAHFQSLRRQNAHALAFGTFTTPSCN